jgi:hypothetical protein
MRANLSFGNSTFLIKNLYDGGNDCNKEASRGVIALFCLGCKNLPLEGLRHPPVIVTDASSHLNNMPDHLHLLVGLRPDAALSGLLREVKASSSKFINERRWVSGKFSWQEGFGAFSYSRSQLGAVIRYIENQQKHHAKKSFRDEYVELLEKFGVEYDTRYIFKFGGE